MVDERIAEQGVEALAVAIATILEDVHDDAVTPVMTLADYRETAAILGCAGADISALATAMDVLVRRSKAAP